MSEKLIVVGELHQDLYYESEFYDDLVRVVVRNLVNFVRFNPDDLMNSKIIERIVKNGFSDTPKKIVGHCFFKRGGNGNNSSEFLAKLNIPTKLVSVIGRGSEWMYPELENLGIETSAIFQIDEITPVSTIIKSSFTTKIHLAPNLKNRMNFDGIKIDDKIFQNTKIIFSTPLAEKFVEIFEKGSKLGLITAYNIETQKITSLEKLSRLIRQRYDLFFLNLKDAHRIIEEKLPIEKVDEIFKKYAKIRVYTAGKEGSRIYTDFFNISFPGVEVKGVIDRTGAGDCYAAGFLSKFYKLVENKKSLDKLSEKSNSQKFKEILTQCGTYGTYSAIYKITKQLAPTPNELDTFIDTFDLT